MKKEPESIHSVLHSQANQQWLTTKIACHSVTWILQTIQVYPTQYQRVTNVCQTTLHKSSDTSEIVKILQLVITVKKQLTLIKIQEVKLLIGLLRYIINLSSFRKLFTL